MICFEWFVLTTRDDLCITLQAWHLRALAAVQFHRLGTAQFKTARLELYLNNTKFCFKTVIAVPVFNDAAMNVCMKLAVSLAFLTTVFLLNVVG